jgi:hypothetical protein
MRPGPADHVLLCVYVNPEDRESAMRRRLVLLPMLLAACATAPALSPGVKLDPDTRPACAVNCEKMGLRLAAVVLVRNSVGCVCAVPEATPEKASGAVRVPAGGAMAIASGVLIADDEAAQQQFQEQSQLQQAAPPPTSPVQ